ncbi:MAG TPA: hypothetical protein VII99_10270, partial [Bacteroidia bacterium]
MRFILAIFLLFIFFLPAKAQSPSADHPQKVKTKTEQGFFGFKRSKQKSPKQKDGFSSTKKERSMHPLKDFFSSQHKKSKSKADDAYGSKRSVKDYGAKSGGQRTKRGKNNIGAGSLNDAFAANIKSKDY